MKLVFKPNDLLYYILLLMPFVDLMTGYAFNEGITGPITYLGQIYRILTFLYLFCLLFTRKLKKKHLWLLLFTVYVFSLIFVNYVRFQGSMIENFSYTLKLLLPMYLVYGLYQTAQDDQHTIERLFRSYSWIYPLSLVIPKVLGIGYSVTNYAFESGYKGFYYANNELNVILMVLFVYCFHVLYNKIMAHDQGTQVIRLDIVHLIKLLLIVFALLLIGSKTSILAIVIVCLAYLFRNERFRYKLKFIGVFFTVGLVGIAGVAILLSDQITNMAQRLVYSYNRYVSAGFITFLLSKRNLRIEPGVDYWYRNGPEGLFNFLFGVGKDTKCPTDGIRVDAFAMIEMDFFDCMFWFGVIAACIVMLFYLHFFLKSIKRNGLFMEKTMFLLVFCFSMIAGHIMTSANSGTILALVTADIYIKTMRQKRSQHAMIKAHAATGEELEKQFDMTR